MKLVLVLVGLALTQAQSSWLDDFDPESAYLSIISLRRDIEPMNETLSDDEGVTPEDEEDMPPPPPPGPRPGPPGPPPRPSGPRPGPPSRRDECGVWGEWEQAKCFWPSESLDKLPPSCAAIPTKPDWPTWMKKFIASKAMEKYNMLMDEYKARGAPPKCGYCTRSFECRIRNDTSSAKRFCPMKEVRPLFNEDCEDKMACEVTQERGGCPPPLFLGGGRRERLQGMIRKGNHEEFSSELFKMRKMEDSSMGGRQKRQSDFPSFDETTSSFMPFQPQYDFPYEMPMGRGGFGGPMGVPFGDDSFDGPMNRPPGQESRRGGDGRRGGPGSTGARGPGRRGPGGPQRRGPGGPPPPADENNFPMPSFDFPPSFRPRVPGGGRGPRPQGHPDFPFFPSNDDGFPPMGRPMGPPPPPQFGPGSRPPFGGEQQFPPRRPFVPGPGSDRRPFGPRPGPSEDAPFPPPMNGPMVDGRGPRVERQPGPYGSSQQMNTGSPFRARFQYGPGMSAAPRFAMFFNNNRRGGMSSPNSDAPMRFGPSRRLFGPPPPHHRFLMELFHGTTCASNGKQKCLCCCGHYIPNIDTGVCEDLRQLLPGIETMVDGVDRENQRPQPPRDPQPQMRQMKKQQFVDF